MTDLLRDLRYAFRSAVRQPGYAIVSTLILALAIGAATTVGSVAERALVRPLPFPRDDQLVTLFESNGSQQRLASYPVFLDWVAQSRSFSGLSFIRGNTATLRASEGAETVLIGYVSTGHFTTMGAAPMLGRAFDADEERVDAGSPVVLSHEYWMRRFGGDRNVIGRTLSLDIATLTIVGVMPRGTKYPAWADMWRPLAAVAATDPALSQRGVRTDSRVVARLRDDVSVQSASAEMRAIATRLAAAYPADAAGWTQVQIAPLRNEVIGDVGPMLFALMAAVALALLIACVNITNLSLVRAFARAREMAIRAALGASRLRMTRQLLAESMSMAAVAGVVGMLITWWATSAIRTLAPTSLPRSNELTVDLRVMTLAVAVTAITAVLCGLAPMLHTLRADLTMAMRGGRSAMTSTPSGQRIQSLLTVAQFALALMLLVGAGLLVRSYRQVQKVDIGLEPNGVIAVHINPPSPQYDSARSAAMLYDRLMAAVRAVPGVTGAAIVNHAPLGFAGVPTQLRIPGRAVDTTGADAALYKTVSVEYAQVMQIPVLHGRWFTEADMTPAATGVVVSKLLAERYWPNESAIGKSLTVFKSSQAHPDFGSPIGAQVIGVVGDVHHFGMESDPVNEVYVPYTSEPWPHAMLLIRTTRSVATAATDIRRALLSVEPDIPLSGASRQAGINPLAANIEILMASRTWMMSVITAFAAAALLLAALGIYGVTAYLVAQRTQEMGVRMALGATHGEVMRLVIRRGVLLAGGGAVIGLVGSLVMTRTMQSLLFATSAIDPLVIGSVMVVLALVALVACYVPARRAARVDPAVALRGEY